METIQKCLLVILLAGLTLNAYSQLNVVSDGGVKIGTMSGRWGLTSKGLEVSVGDVLVHTTAAKGTFLISSKLIPVTSYTGTSVSTKIEPATTITGSNLFLGSSTQYAHSVYVTNLMAVSQTSPSDARYKENISEIGEVTDKIMQLRPVFYDLKKNDGYVGDTIVLKNKVGFIAQEVQPLFPELVRYMEEPDMYAMDYVSLIPYLTRVIQTQETRLREQAEVVGEQEERIEALERLVVELLNKESWQAKSPKKASATKNGTSDQAKLYQNMPNPFTERTVISYELPERVSSAKLLVHSMDGQLIKAYTLSPTAESGYVSVYAGILSPGIYTYSLTVNNRAVDTKRMVVVE